MKLKTKLEPEYDFDFDLVGIVSSAKEYTLAWHFNQDSFLHFVKANDIEIEFKNQSRIIISNFVFESEFVRVLLLRNKLLISNSRMNQYFIPELQRFDYLIQMKTETAEPNVNQVIEKARSIPLIQYVMKLDTDKIKNKENLLF